MEHKAGLDGAVDDITALGATGKKKNPGKMTWYVETLMYKVLLRRCCGSVSILCASRRKKKKKKRKKEKKIKRCSQEANASTFTDFFLFFFSSESLHAKC